MERKKQTIVEEMRSVDPHKIKLLEELGQLQTILASWPDAKIDVQETGVIVSGFPTDVNDIKVRISSTVVCTHSPTSLELYHMPMQAYLLQALIFF